MEREVDVRLARALLAGEPEAFERFVEHFRSKIFHHSMLVCGNPADAEEVAQETLLKVLESFHQLRDPERVRAWVFRIARNCCLLQARKSVFAPQHEVGLDELPPTSDVADSSSLPDQQVQTGELRALLDHVISELPESYRSVVLLRDLEELSTEETDQILEVSPDAVKTRLHRARSAMRQKLDCYLNSHCFDVEPVASPPPMSECAWDDLRTTWRAVTGVTAGRS